MTSPRNTPSRPMTTMSGRSSKSGYAISVVVTFHAAVTNAVPDVDAEGDANAVVNRLIFPGGCHSCKQARLRRLRRTARGESLRHYIHFGHSFVTFRAIGGLLVSSIIDVADRLGIRPVVGQSMLDAFTRVHEVRLPTAIAASFRALPVVFASRWRSAGERPRKR